MGSTSAPAAGPTAAPTAAQTAGRPAHDHPPPGGDNRRGGGPDRWVDAGIITAEQAEAIRTFERGAAPGEPSRSALVAEVLAYLGAALVVAAVAVLLGDRWSDFSRPLQIGLVAAATTVGLVAGALARRRSGDPFRRVTSVLWLASVGGVAGLSMLVVGDGGLDRSDDVVALVTVLLALAVAVALFVLHRTALQLAPVVGLSVAVAPLVLQAATDLSADAGDAPAYGALVLAGGGAWLVQSLRPVVAPAWVGFVLGGFAAYVGCTIITSDWMVVGLGLATAGALGLVVLSLRTRQLLHLFVGAVGLFMTLPRLAVELFGESVGAPLALLAVGVLVIAVAILTGRMHRRRTAAAGGDEVPGPAVDLRTPVPGDGQPRPS